MTREINDHKVNPANDRLVITAADDPGAGGANHAYCITGYDASKNPSANDQGDETWIFFQNGPIPEVGINGVTQEALLAIVADRLRSFQKGPYSTKENACALTHIEEAMHWLHARTLARMRRGIEGTHTV